MKALLLLLALLMGSPAAAETVAIVNAVAWTMRSGEPVRNATIVMDDGRIRSVTPDGAVPAGARVIDAVGRTVTPGLMNGATHLGLVEVSAAEETNDQAVTSGPLGAGFDVQYALNPNSTLIAQARADGLARAMSMPSRAANAPFSGFGAVINLADDGKFVERARAGMFAAVGSSTLGRAGGSRSAQWVLLRNALDEARRFGPARQNLAPRDQLLNRLDAAALTEVLSGGVPLAISAQRESDIRQAIRLARDYRIRVVVIGGAEAWRAAPELASAKIPVVLDPMANLPMSFDELGARLDNAALLDAAGVTIAFTVPGSGIHLSHNAGFALREGAGIAVANGLPYAAALRALTVNPAQIWHPNDRYGTLAAGADADLVIWDGDPLEPASAPAAVFNRGREVSLRTRQTELRDRYAPSRTSGPRSPAQR